MNLECGPLHDRRVLNLELPQLPTFKNKTLENLFYKSNRLIKENKLACLISGGMDSALLYFLLLEENYLTGRKFVIEPYTIRRKDGSWKFAKSIIDWIHDYHCLPKVDLNLVGDNTLPEIRQVASATQEILHNHVNFVYYGEISSRPEHYVGWVRGKFQDNFYNKYPFLNLEKSHIVDLYFQKNIVELLKLTRSCIFDNPYPCGSCNACNERAWGFKEIGRIDPAYII